VPDAVAPAGFADALIICLSGSTEDHPSKRCELQYPDDDGAPCRAGILHLRPDIAVEQLDQASESTEPQHDDHRGPEYCCDGDKRHRYGAGEGVEREDAAGFGLLPGSDRAWTDQAANGEAGSDEDIDDCDGVEGD
jgi:hypothetical protein